MARREPPGKRLRKRAGKEKPAPEGGALDFIDLAYTKFGRSRFTQDSPILPDVFNEYGARPGVPRDVLLTPDWSRSAAEVAAELKDSLRIEPAHPHTRRGAGHKIAYNQSVVAAHLRFEELLCHVLPLSWWWQNGLTSIGLDPVSACENVELKKTIRGELLAGLELGVAGSTPRERDIRSWTIREDFVWAARLFWAVEHATPKARGDSESIADYFLERLIPRISRLQAARQAKPREGGAGSPPRSAWVHSISRNRRIERAALDSLKTTKADAAVHTFGVRGKGITWAVIDTGIDARHLAFRKTRSDGRLHEQPFGEDGANHTRIKATYDFSEIRERLSQDQENAVTGQVGRLVDWEKLEKSEATKKKKGARFRIEHNREGYESPQQSHGTHVAGILGANWRPEAMEVDPLSPPPNRQAPKEAFAGLCPEIEMYDLRVFKKDGSCDEFAIMSALQFVRGLNQRHDTLEVHGVNISLAMEHDVRNYACGRSPVCEECTRLVGNGVVVVAAAGNQGRSIHTTIQESREEGYRTVSIADPGNAEAVITVGSTHRNEPHTYGVSYFSSRGPTGDGRLKPDLVAPGEKILSTVPGDRIERMDGTSQAAPHVSGAAALLMSRHFELIGQPARIKQVLMDSATDLGRERHFQGAGLVDIMRALQSL